MHISEEAMNAAAFPQRGHCAKDANTRQEYLIEFLTSQAPARSGTSLCFRA
jgi:hypothetical protein